MSGPDIVVLGGGYAGLRAILDLAASVECGRLEACLTLVDRSPRHEVVTLLHQVATEACPRERAALRLARLVPKSVRRLQTDVEALDTSAGRVLTASGPVPYDRLVVALGSATCASSLPPQAPKNASPSFDSW